VICGVSTAKMKQRKYIQELIVDAWSDTVAHDYCRQRINSERSLQASFWSQINMRLPKNRRLFIEPPMKVEKSNEFNRLLKKTSIFPLVPLGNGI